MVSAMSAGECIACLEPYALGEQLGLLADGWAHLDCYELTIGGAR